MAAITIMPTIVATAARAGSVSGVSHSPNDSAAKLIKPAASIGSGPTYTTSAATQTAVSAVAHDTCKSRFSGHVNSHAISASTSDSAKRSAGNTRHVS